MTLLTICQLHNRHRRTRVERSRRSSQGNQVIVEALGSWCNQSPKGWIERGGYTLVINRQWWEYADLIPGSMYRNRSL